MSPQGYRLRAPLPVSIAIVLTLTLAAAMVAGLLAGGPTAGPAHTAALLAGAGLLVLVVAGKRTGVPWTWIALGAGAFAVGMATNGMRYDAAAQPEPLIAAAGFLLLWAGIWLIREQRVRYGRVEFVLDAMGSLIAVCVLGALVTLLGRGPYRDASELWYTLGICTAISLTAVIPLMTAVARTPYCSRDRWMTAAFAAGLLGHIVLTWSIRRDVSTGGVGFALYELQLPLLAIAATQRPGVAGTKVLGTWWEWVPPTAWTIVGGGTLIADRWVELPLPVVLLAAATLAFAVVRFAHTVRMVGRTVLERHESLTDELTGLPNRHVLFEDLALLTHSRGASGETATLLVVGIDNFRSLTDTLGHRAGDRLLVAVAGRLASAIADRAQLMRMSGDEFAVIVRAPESADEIRDALIRSMADLFEIDGINLSIEASIGLARFPDDAIEAQELARLAEVAMTDAKRRRIGAAYYDAEQDASSVAQLALADDLRQALEHDDGGLWVGFQPQLDVTSGTMHGAEALLRWTHPTHGEIRPDQVLPIAERNGLLTPLTDWMLEQAASAAASLAAHHGTNLRFAVNVSAATLVDVRLPRRIDEILHRYGVLPQQLVIEITEDALMSDERRCLEVVDRIAALGVEIAIDDFGTGHSTLSQLRSLPANELKVDRAFVQAMTADLLDAEIVRLIVRMGRQVGLRVVAEGVETNKERRMLADFGCSVVQGYGIAKPMPLAELSAFLAGHSSGGAGWARAA